MHVVDGMPDTGSGPLWPVWLGLAGIGAGVAMLLFWGRQRPTDLRDPADDQLLDRSAGH
jgi:LPXTG-motif cell wall-anchored protein